MMTKTGKPKFMAPETFDGQPYDSKVDIWGAGVTLFFLLSGGFLPFDRENEAALIRDIKEREPQYDYPAFNRLSQDALSLLKLTLSKDPRQRPTAEECLQHPWFKQALSDQRESPLRKRPAVLGGNVKNCFTDLELLKVGLDFSPLLEQQEMIKESTKSLECHNLMKNLPVPRSSSTGKKQQARNRQVPVEEGRHRDGSNDNKTNRNYINEWFNEIRE